MWNYVSFLTFNWKLTDFEATEPEDKNTALFLFYSVIGPVLIEITLNMYIKIKKISNSFMALSLKYTFRVQ